MSGGTHFNKPPWKIELNEISPHPLISHPFRIYHLPDVFPTVVLKQCSVFPLLEGYLVTDTIHITSNLKQNGGYLHKWKKYGTRIRLASFYNIFEWNKFSVFVLLQNLIVLSFNISKLSQSKKYSFQSLYLELHIQTIVLTYLKRVE